MPVYVRCALAFFAMRSEEAASVRFCRWTSVHKYSAGVIEMKVNLSGKTSSYEGHGYRKVSECSGRTEHGTDSFSAV